MKRMFARSAALVAAMLPLAGAPYVLAQQNGEAHSAVPAVVRTDYDMLAFIKPLPLNETESKGRALFGQKCANCHRGTAQNPGPLLGQPTVERLGDAAVRTKVSNGSPAMPGFKDTLQAAQVDQIIAFLKTFTPPRPQGSEPG